MIALKICAFAIAGVVLLLLVKSNAPAFGVICEITLVLVALVTVLPQVNSLMGLLEGLQDVSAVSQSALKILFKTFGFLMLGGVVADICRDNGEGAVAGVVDFCVKILAISCALPVFTAVVEVALTFFNR